MQQLQETNLQDISAIDNDSSAFYCLLPIVSVYAIFAFSYIIFAAAMQDHNLHSTHS